MSSSENFLGDPDFCTECGAILPLPGLSINIVCKVCSHEVDARSLDGLTVTSEIIFSSGNRRRVEGKQAEIPDGPLVDRKCSKCGHEGMTYATLQTRSADEGQTVFYTCPQCKFKEIENS